MRPCWLYQKLVSWHMDDGGAFPAFLQRHLDRCDACQAYVASQRKLVQGLISENLASHREAPVFLKTRILAHLSESRQPAPFPPIRALPVGAWAAAGTAVLALMTMAIYLPTQHTGQPAGPSVPPGFLSTERMLATTTNLAALSTVVEQPLEKEMNLVIGDAKKAVQVLAQNFLPDELWR